jgi:hypothetical protein
MFVRIPIDNVFAYAAPGASNVYEFPLAQLLSKDIKFTKNNNYLLTFRHENQNVNFEYEMYQGDAAPNKLTMQNIGSHSNEVINNMFNDRYGMTNQRYGYIANGTELCSNFLLAFYDMNVLIAREVGDISNFVQFTQKQTTHSKNYLELTQDMFSLINECSNRRDVKYLASKGDSIIWNGVNTNIQVNDDDLTQMMYTQNEQKNNRKFNLVSFECLFKNTYNKSITNSDKLYYVFGNYLGNFIFIKLITALDIECAGNDNRLTKIFQKGYQIMDCYMCEELIE